MKKLFILLFILIIYSTNFPQWYQLNSGINDLLESVQFVNEQIGWITGVYGGMYHLYKTTNGGSDWNLQYSHPDPLGILFQNEYIGWLNIHHTWGDEIYKTIDGGDNWTLSYSGNIEVIYDLDFISLDTGWCVGWVEFGYLFKETTDGGLTWINKNVSPNYYGELISIEIIDNMNFIITGQYILFKSTNGGNTWQELSSFDYLYNLQFFNMNVGWCKEYNVNGGRLINTTNGGITWNQQAQPIRSYQFTTEQIGWYVNVNEIYHSTDGGNSWTLQYSDTNHELIDVFFLNNNNGWAVGTNGTILLTFNGGIPVELVNFTADISDNEVILKWSTATEKNNQGFEIQRMRGFKITELQDWQKIGFVEGHGTITETQFYSFIDESLKPGNYQYRLKQIDFDGSFEFSEIVKVEIGIPESFSLSQNYPNPFNPTTKISWQSPVSSYTTLKVYDVLGNEIATLVDEYKPAGSYEIEFDASHLSSGVYFYTMISGVYSETRKMTVLK